MLWPASGRPKLLLPRDLLPELDDAERDALLAHELAHVLRRDHWVRFLEIGATALFWWYPVAWWSRSALRRAEERCCDEWVLRALPGSARAYASGILKSLTFLSETPVPLPETASGAGPIRDLESRLKEILMTTPRPLLSRPIRLAFGGFAVAALAAFPTVGPPRSAQAAAAVVAADGDVTPPSPGAPVASPARPSAVAPPAPASAGSPVLAPAPLAVPAPAAFPALAPLAPAPDAPGRRRRLGGREGRAVGRPPRAARRARAAPARPRGEAGAARDRERARGGGRRL